MSILTVSIELAPMGAEQNSVVMRPHTATTFGPLTTVGLGLLVSGLLYMHPVLNSRVSRPVDYSVSQLGHNSPVHATPLSFGR